MNRLLGKTGIEDMQTERKMEREAELESSVS
jgi:hypothetical protein